MVSKTYQLETLTCPSCVAKIEGMLHRTKGVVDSEVPFNSGRVWVFFDEFVLDAGTIKNNIQKLGFKVLSSR